MAGVAAPMLSVKDGVQVRHVSHLNSILNNALTPDQIAICWLIDNEFLISFLFAIDRCRQLEFPEQPDQILVRIEYAHALYAHQHCRVPTDDTVNA